MKMIIKTLNTSKNKPCSPEKIVLVQQILQGNLKITKNILSFQE